MRFRDLFNRYVNNQANETETTYIEEEIEKVQIINDYLADKIEDELNIKDDNLSFTNKELSSSSNENEGSNGLKEIKKAINKELIQIGVTSALWTITFLLALKFIISPIMDQVYYNPLEIVDGNSPKMTIDLDVISELHFPGISTVQTSYDSLGFGKYDVSIWQQGYSDEDNNSYNTTIDKNKFIVSDDFYKFPPINLFTRGTYPFYEYPTDRDDMYVEQLKELPDYINAKVMVSFKEDLEVKDLLSTLEGINVDNNWVGVRCFPLDTQTLPLIGFVVDDAGISFEEEHFDTDKYPYFDLGWADVDHEDLTSEILEIHFKSLLKYMGDNEDFAKTNILFEDCDLFYNNALDYVNKNGIKSYGIVVTGSPSEILKLREHPMVESIYLDDLYL